MGLFMQTRTVRIACKEEEERGEKKENLRAKFGDDLQSAFRNAPLVGIVPPFVISLSVKLCLCYNVMACAKSVHKQVI